MQSAIKSSVSEGRIEASGLWISFRCVRFHDNKLVNPNFAFLKNEPVFPLNIYF